MLCQNNRLQHGEPAHIAGKGWLTGNTGCCKIISRLIQGVHERVCFSQIATHPLHLGEKLIRSEICVYSHS